jgi:LacI family transcriptional regulator
MNKRYRLVALMPDNELDEYWKPCIEGIFELRDMLEEKGVFVEVLKYSPSNPSHFREVCQQSMDLDPDGVLLGALFLNESKEYLTMLAKKMVPFILINTVVEHAQYHAFVGQNLTQSGRTVAQLFDMFLPAKKTILIVHFEEEYENAYHMQQKEAGFRSYYKEENEDTVINTLNIKVDDHSTVSEQFDSEIQGNVDGIFVTTSKAHHIAKTNIGVPIIGYDLLNENINCLKNGKIKFLIYQNPKLQAFQGLSFLADLLLKGAQPPHQKFLPIEIISSENVDSYQT